MHGLTEPVQARRSLSTGGPPRGYAIPPDSTGDGCRAAASKSVAFELHACNRSRMLAAAGRGGVRSEWRGVEWRRLVGGPDAGRLEWSAERVEGSGVAHAPCSRLCDSRPSSTTPVPGGIAGRGHGVVPHSPGGMRSPSHRSARAGQGFHVTRRTGRPPQGAAGRIRMGGHPNRLGL